MFPKHRRLWRFFRFLGQAGYQYGFSLHLSEVDKLHPTGWSQMVFCLPDSRKEWVWSGWKFWVASFWKNKVQEQKYRSKYSKNGDLTKFTPKKGFCGSKYMCENMFIRSADPKLWGVVLMTFGRMTHRFLDIEQNRSKMAIWHVIWAEKQFF